MESDYHESVLVSEVTEALHIEKTRPPNGEASKYIDATLGNGGHTLEILKKGGEVLGIDLDPTMLTIAEERLEASGEKNYKLVNGNFTEIDKIAAENGFSLVNGILFDLGVTNIHLKDLERGFSFENPEAPLRYENKPGGTGC